MTGSEGFVGQHLVNLLKKDYLVIGISRHEILKGEENVKYEICDILKPDLFYSVLERNTPDIIIHLAAIAVTWANDPKGVFEVNFQGTMNIYESVLKLKEKENYAPKILYVSSADVYGKTKNPENITEDSPFFPINYYAVSKVAADRLSYQYSQNKKLNVVIARPFNHTGPGQKQGFFVPDMVSQIVNAEKNGGGEIKVGNTDSVKDFLDVRDVTSAYKLLIETDTPTGEAYNICSGKGIKFKNILDKLIEKAKVKINIKVDQSRMRPSEIPVLIGNNEKFTSLTGWKSEYNLDQTLEDTLEYWRVS